jgi:hypothetical protein
MHDAWAARELAEGQRDASTPDTVRFIKDAIEHGRCLGSQ